jgi:hypothetical protein
VAVVAALDFLQTDDVGVEFVQTGTQLMYPRDSLQAKELAHNPFVNVVGGNPDMARR